MGEDLSRTEWTVLFTDCFNTWLLAQDEDTQNSILATIKVLHLFGPKLSRPYADTLHGSQFPNMKELRIQHKGKPLRAFFAFDPLRQAIILCAGDKSNDKKFYDRMISLADQEFARYLETLER